MKKIFISFFMILILFFSQTTFAKELYNTRDINLYENEIPASAFNDNVQITDSKIPIKVLGVTVKNINVKNDKKVYLGGQTIGIAVYLKGLLVTDIVAIENESGKLITPAIEGNINKGDYILSANGIELRDISNLDAILKNNKGEKIKLKILRDEKEFITEITPVKSKKDSRYRLGLMLKDSAAGLGTTTFIDPDTNTFMALGHSICDNETGKMLSLNDGRVVECIVTGIKKGEKGKAGELKGTFGINARQLGIIKQNTNFGISGKNSYLNKGEFVYIGSKDSIIEGKAYIYSDFDTGEIKKYEIEIIHINNQTYPSEKSMVIKITDKELIEKTGGIIQGLSGSPIIQNGKLIGAITHVLVNDPTRGYAIFAENMLETAQHVADEKALKDAS